MSGRLSESALLAFLAGLLCMDALDGGRTFAAVMWAITAVLWTLTTGVRIAARSATRP